MKFTFFKAIALSAVLQGSLAERGSSSKFRKDVHFLLYDKHSELENDPTSSLHFFKERSEVSGIRTTVYGGALKESGSGDKLRLLQPILEVANNHELIVVADAREVLLNVPADAKIATEAVDAFLETFGKLTNEHPNAVVVSAEEHCCSAAMSHSSPGDYFDGMTRNHRACESGAEGCKWEGENERVVSWKESMREIALDETFGEEEYNNVYLNSGILAGYAKNLLQVLKVSDIGPSEDDRAVLTDLMLASPEMIRLDYHQELFGTNPVHKGLSDGCLFEREGSSLQHMTQMTRPLILQTPNKFYDCLDTMIDAMGGTSQQRYLTDYGNGDEGLERRLQAFPEAQRKLPVYMESESNYGTYGTYGTYVWTPEEFLQTFLFGQYGYFANYGNYGNYGQYGNYGLFNLLLSRIYNSGPSGRSAIQERSDGNGQYGFYIDFNTLFWGLGGNYGNYGMMNYGNYGTYRRGLKGSVDAPTEIAKGLEKIGDVSEATIEKVNVSSEEEGLFSLFLQYVYAILAFFGF
eukprot:CAMPEP_0116132046 /NCGR_PEP_ID=MMETSP0329-20121206/9338_1 /TAXON_ID=697910 /ORGANISM="Pseudo-nitzschia arenysensis, Strain B593" /LENGTH=520 /DNA_ID=CAMNT_0003626533 /DNA_START=86 /DNA_END=1648 /DNA_ORIENTATION=+